MVTANIYPEDQISEEVDANGAPFIIRPIGPDDAPRLEELFDRLSRESVYFRFLRNLKSLPSGMLHRFTHIDYGRDVALAAVRKEGDTEKILGVSRIMRSDDSSRGEAAVAVADEMQRRGIGTRLFERALEVANSVGFTRVWALISEENESALKIAARMGFSQSPHPEEGVVELEKRLGEE